jgi:SAM-dependent methyltransferase
MSPAGNRGGGIPAEALLDLRRRLDGLPPRHAERRTIVDGAADLFGVSRATVYRALQGQLRPKGLRRADRGVPRKIPQDALERFCEVIAALKIRTSNKKGRRLSTVRAIQLIEEHGVETPDGLVRAAPGLLNRATVNRYLSHWGYDHARMTRAPMAVRFEARASNALWQFDVSHSDLKEIEQPAWVDPGRRGPPVPMLFSVVDDRSGVAFQEYRCVYGEDVETGLRFLFNAMAPKEGDAPTLQGVPDAIYLDNGPIAKSGVFQTVMERLGVRVMTHMPAGSDGRRVSELADRIALRKGDWPPHRRTVVVEPDQHMTLGRNVDPRKHLSPLVPGRRASIPASTEPAAAQRVHRRVQSSSTSGYTLSGSGTPGRSAQVSGRAYTLPISRPDAPHLGERCALARLIAEWGLAPHGVAYVDRQQGTRCTDCGSNLRSMVLASAVAEELGIDRPLLGSIAGSRAAIFEINKAEHMHGMLSQAAGHAFARYPKVDMQNMPYHDRRFDLGVHFDMLEHVPRPVRALSECRGVPRPGGVLSYTVSVIVERLIRRREGLAPGYHGAPGEAHGDHLVVTEYGADVWTETLRAGFGSVRLVALDFPDALALVARAQHNSSFSIAHIAAIGSQRPDQIHRAIAENILRQLGKSIPRRQRDPNFISINFFSLGVDIGGGPYPLMFYCKLFRLMTAVKVWDLEDGDAEFMEDVADGTFDFLHSSHCLGRLHDLVEGPRNWLRVTQPVGYVVVTVPDEDRDGQGVSPSTINRDDKVTFTLYKQRSWSARSVNLPENAHPARAGGTGQVSHREIPLRSAALRPGGHAGRSVRHGVRSAQSAAGRDGRRRSAAAQPVPDLRRHYNQYRDDYTPMTTGNADAPTFQSEGPL